MSRGCKGSRGICRIIFKREGWYVKILTYQKLSWGERAMIERGVATILAGSHPPAPPHAQNLGFLHISTPKLSPNVALYARTLALAP